MNKSCLGLSVLLACAACREAPVDAAPLAAPQTLSLAAAITPVDPAVAKLPLSERLLREETSRPLQAVRSEQLLRALDTQGLTVVKKRQVLASTLGASYCEMSMSAAGLGVSLCEFADKEAARAGSDRSFQLFDKIVPGRTLLLNDNSLLTITHADGDPAERESRLIASTFLAQKATPLPR